jgi:hypothetical protein
MFYTGYLTIGTISRFNYRRYYNLIPPNKEVKWDYFNILSEVLLSKQGKNKAEEADTFRNAVLRGDTETLEDIIFDFFDGLTECHGISDSFYHSVFWAYCHGLFKTTEMEELGSLGDLEMAIELEHNVYAIFEIKYGYPGPTELEYVPDNMIDSPDDDYEKADGAQKAKAKQKAKTISSGKTISPGKKLTTALKKEVNVGVKLNELAENALAAVEEKKSGLKYRVPGNTVIDIGLGVYWRGYVKIAFRRTLY